MENNQELVRVSLSPLQTKKIWLFKAAGENFHNLGQNMQAQMLKLKLTNSSQFEQPSS